MGRGKRLKEPPGSFAYELRVDRKAKAPLEFPPLDWHAGADGQLLLSKRLVALLDRLGVTNIDRYDVSVVYGPTQRSLEYTLANVIGIASVLDRAKSQFVADADGFIIELLEISIDASLCADWKFFRFQELSSLIVISTEVADAFRQEGITGVTIIAPEAWEPGII